MILPVLLAQTAPRDLTPPNALARSKFAVDNDLLLGTGLPPLRRQRLLAGDIEVRYWGGFAWGTEALILRRAKGRWSASHIVLGERRHPAPLPPPRSGWPLFWTRAENIGIWTLPDESRVQGWSVKDRIVDGYSTLVEYQKDGGFRAYFYDNPKSGQPWPEARRMAALDRLIRSEFPTFISEDRDLSPTNLSE